MFGLESPSRSETSDSSALPICLFDPQLKLATARGAFHLLSSFLAPKTIWLPSYLCGVVLDAVTNSRANIRFYAVDENLGNAGCQWLEEIIPGDMVVFIDYFGFNRWVQWGAKARERGAWVVEDACQAMLNERFCEHSHYVVFSPRKFVGVPDGGILMMQGNAALPKTHLPPPPVDWWRDAFGASRLRAEFDKTGGDHHWFDLFRKADQSGPLEPTQMSEMSSHLLTVIDYKSMTYQRRRNYRFLAGEIPDLALFPELPDDVVPLGFPIKIQDRDRVRGSLFARQIYPAVHWPIADIVPSKFLASHLLAQEIMTLPCDQRYDFDDLKRMISALQQIIAQ